MAKKTTLENTGTNTPKSGAHEENAKKPGSGKTRGASGRESSAKPFDAGATAPATSADIGRDDPAIAD